MVTVDGNRCTVEFSIQEALELQQKLSAAIACAMRQREKLPAGLTSFREGTIVSVNGKMAAGVITFDVNPNADLPSAVGDDELVSALKWIRSKAPAGMASTTEIHAIADQALKKIGK